MCLPFVNEKVLRRIYHRQRLSSF